MQGLGPDSIAAGHSSGIEDPLGRGNVCILQLSGFGKVGRVRSEVCDRTGVVFVDGRQPATRCGQQLVNALRVSPALLLHVNHFCRLRQ